MRPRRENASQKWHCSKCGEVTIHTIRPNATTYRTKVEGKHQAVRRKHYCNQCREPLATLELDEDVVDGLFSEVRELRSIAGDYEKLCADYEALEATWALISRAQQAVQKGDRVLAQIIQSIGKPERAGRTYLREYLLQKLNERKRSA